MPASALNSATRAFLSKYVRSVEQLEILLLLGGTPSKTWTVQSVYDTILSTPVSVEGWLNDLVKSGLLEKLPEPSSYRCCTDEGMVAQICALAEVYRTLPVRVIEAIYQREAGAAQSFADAFKLKKPEDNP